MYHSYSKSSYTKQFNHHFPVRRWLAFLLTVCMLIPMTAPFVSTAENAVQSQLTEENALSDVLHEEFLPEFEAELSPNINPVLLRNETLSNENLPFAMSLNDAQEKGFVGRVKAVENDLHSVVLADNDGDLTLYYYKDPIKYIDELGQVKDKSDKLYAYKDGSFATMASDIRTDLPKNLADGIILRKDDYRLQLSPNGFTNAIGTLSNDQRVVTYALNNQTSYQYSLTAMGFKEDIVVSEYTGQTEYTFTLQTHGLTPVNDNGTYVLVDNDGIQRATLGDVIIFTADERNNTFGELLVEELVAGEEYQLTVKVDSAWLSDPETAYPITIDPALSYVDGDFTIEDMVVGTSTTYSKTSSSLYVGRGSSGAKIRTLMRFPNLNITGYNVTSATVSIRDLMCESEAQTVQCYEYIGTEWAGSGTFAWNDMGSSPIGIFLDEKTISYANGSALATNKHRYEFNITALAQKWANDTASPTKGLMFKATDTYETSGTKTFKTFASVDRGSHSPRMVVNYQEAININTPTSAELVVGSSLTLTATVNPPNTTVTWASSNPSLATVNSSGTSCTVTGVHAGNVNITATTEHGDVYSIALLVILQNGAYSIQNAYSKLYLSTEVNCSAIGSNIRQDIIKTTEPDYLASMWKIHHLGDGIYSIRPMHILDHALGTESDNTHIHHTYNGTRDTLESVGINFRWVIDYTDSGYKLICVGNNRTLSIPSNTTAIGATVGLYSSTANYLRHYWNLNRTPMSSDGVILYDRTTNECVAGSLTRFVSIGKTQSLLNLYLTAKVYSDFRMEQSSITWSSSNPTVASVDSNGNVTGLSPGTTIIKATPKFDADGEIATYTVIVPSLRDGIYYIQNRQHNNYVQADDATAPNYTQPGVALEQWAFDGRIHQKWELMLQYDGYYRIRSTVSGLYMATQLGGEGTENLFIVQENLLTSPRQLWRISITSHGSYKIKAKSSEPYEADLVMVSANLINGSAEGIQVQQRLYVNNESYKDEWYFEDAEFHFVHYYDGSVTNPYQIECMTESTDLVDKIFYDNFRIHIRMDGAPTLKEDALVDDCSLGYTSPCSDNICGHNCYEHHHKNTYRISNQLYYQNRERNHIYILWSGHNHEIYCKGTESEHIQEDALACVWNFRPVIQIMNVPMSAGVLQAYMANILAHEAAHTFGMDDVYDNPNHDVENDWKCIMEKMETVKINEFYNAILTGKESGICDSCYQELKSNVADCFHETNITN